jgi:hypothetical protein
MSGANDRFHADVPGEHQHKNNGYAGDVLLLVQTAGRSLDRTLYSNGRYFAVTNGRRSHSSAADCGSSSRSYDFGSGIKSLRGCGAFWVWLRSF